MSGRYAKAPQKGEPPADTDVPAVAYVRMSTDHQKYSTENQLDVIRNYAAARGLTILRVFEDSGRSGLRLDGREALQKLMSEVKSAKADFKAIAPQSVRRKVKMLDGISEEVASILKDKQCPMAVFEILRKMKVLRQIEAAELLVNANNYSVAYASAILAGTPQSQLVDGSKPKLLKRLTPEAMARMEGELARLQESFTSIQDSYGQDHLQLTVIKGYVAKLLGNARIVRYLMQNRPDFMAEFQTIAEMTTTLPPEAG